MYTYVLVHKVPKYVLCQQPSISDSDLLPLVPSFSIFVFFFFLFVIINARTRRAQPMHINGGTHLASRSAPLRLRRPSRHTHTHTNTCTQSQSSRHIPSYKEQYYFFGIIKTSSRNNRVPVHIAYIWCGQEPSLALRADAKGIIIQKKKTIHTPFGRLMMEDLCSFLRGWDSGYICCIYI